MNYGDVMMSKKSKSETIKIIYDFFEVDSDDIQKACSSAGVMYPNEPIQYYFLAECIDTGRNLRRDYDLEDEMGFDVQDAINQAADGLVPYQTYYIWQLWIEFGYEVDAYQHFGLEPRLDNLENVAQVQLMQYAEYIVSEFGSVKSTGES